MGLSAISPLWERVSKVFSLPWSYLPSIYVLIIWLGFLEVSFENFMSHIIEPPRIAQGSRKSWASFITKQSFPTQIHSVMFISFNFIHPCILLWITQSDSFLKFYGGFNFNWTANIQIIVMNIFVIGKIEANLVFNNNHLH